MALLRNQRMPGTMLLQLLLLSPQTVTLTCARGSCCQPCAYSALQWQFNFTKCQCFLLLLPAWGRAASAAAAAAAASAAAAAAAAANPHLSQSHLCTGIMLPAV
jgi:hypothetical protein